MTAPGPQTVLVTGSTDGIGFHTAAELARRGWTVLLHGRDADKLEASRQAIVERTGNDRIEGYRADFATLNDLAALAEAIGARQDRLDVLINNAGIGRGAGGGRTRDLSADGYELRFQVNHLAPFLLQQRLFPLLRETAPARIVNVASAAQSAIDFDDVMLEHGYDGYRAYSQSKLAVVMATFELARRLEGTEVTVNALHPGTLLDTKMVREGFGEPRGPVEIGVESEVNLATAPELENTTGAYFDRTRPAKAHEQAYDRAACERLWTLSERLVLEAA